MSSQGGRRDRSFIFQHGVSLVLLPLAGALLPVGYASAQVLPSEDGMGTSVEMVGDTINIDGGQHSDDGSNLFQSFEQFDITAEQTANFSTTSDVQNVVGRVNGGGASSVDGTLQVTGSDANLYLMNPAGVLMGPNAQLNLPSSFTATTATGIGFDAGEFEAVRSSDYSGLSGKPSTFHFDAAQAGAVVNLGELSVEEGQAINLVGGTVVNAGELNAPGGSVTMTAVEGGSTVRISQGDQLLSLEVDKHNSALASNGAITPMSIGEMLTGGGLENATTLVTAADGTVSLSGSDTAISEAGGEAIASGSLNVSSELGGEINVLGDRVSLLDANFDASGTNGGGLIRVGGDYQGGGSVHTATSTRVDENTALSADAWEDGDGGRVIVWADESTHFFGGVSAKGGTLGGDGGFSEVSGKQDLIFDGSADLSAAQGKLGTLLLDPENIVITDGAAPPDDLPVTEYRSSASLEDAFANIELTAEKNILLNNLFDDVLKLRRGVSLTIRADSAGNGTGIFSMSPGDTIALQEGSLDISGAVVKVSKVDIEDGNIDISGSSVEVGGITIENGSGNIDISGIGGRVNNIFSKNAAIYISGDEMLVDNAMLEGGNLTISGRKNTVVGTTSTDTRINLLGDEMLVDNMFIQGGSFGASSSNSKLARITSIKANFNILGNEIQVGGTDLKGGSLTFSGSNNRIRDTRSTNANLIISGDNIIVDNNDILAGSRLIFSGTNSTVVDTNLIDASLDISGNEIVVESNRKLGGSLNISG